MDAGSTEEGLSSLTGAQRAAVVLTTMSDNAAAGVLRRMDERTVAAVTDAMATLDSVAPEVSYETHLKLLGDLENSGTDTAGDFARFRNVLTAAFGDQKASEVVERVMRSGDGAMDVLQKIDPKTLAEQIQTERPQLIAVLLGHMNRASAVACLTSLPDDLSVDVLYRFASVETVNPVAITELQAMLSEMLGGHVATQTSNVGGVRQTADLLNGMGPSASDKALSIIRENNEELADRIRENMFTFDDLGNLADQALQLVLREVDQDRLAPALRAASTTMKDRILGNISSKQRKTLEDEIENGPMVTRSDAQAAQRAIIDAAMTLQQDGRISLSGSEDML